MSKAPKNSRFWAAQMAEMVEIMAFFGALKWPKSEMQKSPEIYTLCIPNRLPGSVIVLPSVKSLFLKIGLNLG